MSRAANRNTEKGSIEIMTLALLTVLVVLIALPLLKDVGNNVTTTLTNVRDGQL